MSSDEAVLADGVLTVDAVAVPDLRSFVDAGVHELRLSARVKRAPGLAEFVGACGTLRSLSLHKPALIDSVKASPTLEVLSIEGKAVNSLEFLEGFPALRRLALSSRGTRVSDFGPVRHTPLLERLSANRHLAGTLKPLRSLVHLEEYVGHQPKALASLDGLDGCPKLAHVDANLSRIASLAPLSSAKKLRALKIRGTKVTTLSPLFGCTALETLFAERTKMRAIDGLSDALPGLRMLSLSDTPVMELSPIGGLESLLELGLAGLESYDFSVLAELRTLEHVDLARTSFDDLDLLGSMPRLISARVGQTKIRERDPRVQKLHRKLRAKRGPGAGLHFDSGSGRPRLAVGRAACVHGALGDDERHHAIDATDT